MLSKIIKLLLVFIVFSIQFSEAQTLVTLELDGGGSTTICRGTPIQINATVDVANPNYNYNWRNTTTGDFYKSASGDEGAFLILDGNDTLTQTSDISVEVSGGAQNVSDTISITIQTPLNPGSQGDLLLCNRTGTIDLFTILQGNPDTGGTWSPALSGGQGNFVVGSDTAGIYTYTHADSGVCPASQSSVTVRDCFDDDFDDDGVPNDTDLDDDNDGILDSTENAVCNAGGLSETRPLVDIDFGTGNIPTTDPNILGHDYTPSWPNDGFYNVGTSNYFLSEANFAVFVATDLNPIPNSDGDGDINGRYLAINVAPGFNNQILYQIPDIRIVAGTEYNFRIDLAGLCNRPDGTPCADEPSLELELRDQNLPAGSPPIFSINSNTIGVANNDLWVTIPLNFKAANTTFLTLNIINTQASGSDGNDIGIDNIRFASLECDFDRDEIPNYIDLDSDQDGIYDIVEAGFGNLDGNGDGIVDGPVDANGIPVAANGGLTPTSSNYVDIDSDGDGIQDNIEAQTTTGYIPPSGIDEDRNGVDDAYEIGNNIDPNNADADSDGIPDYLELNSDNDCLPDTVEAYDLNQDGVADIIASGNDADGDGLDDAFDTVTLSLLNAYINPSDGNETPTALPDFTPPGDDVDFREEYVAINEQETLEICTTNTTTVNLIDSLNDAAILGGTWTGPDVLPGGDQGVFDSSVNTPGTYTYTLPQIGTCPSRTGKVEITVQTDPEAGTNNAITLCTEATAVNLINNLGGTPHTGGTWTDPDGNLFGTNDQGALDPATAIGGVYTYTVGTTTCNAAATVTVTLEDNLDAGDDANLSICASDVAVNLFTQLLGTPDTGGSWTDPNGNPFGTGDTANLDPAAINALSGNYTYSISSVNCTVPDTAIITVTITNQPDAGIDNAITLCTEAAAVNLINNLGGIPDTSGSWTDPNGNPFGTNDRGALDPATAIGGVYTYTVGTTTCNAAATVTVTLEDNLDAGDDANLSICASDVAVNLFTQLLGTPDTGGSWTDPNGNPFGTGDTANLDPAAINALSGNYTYSISSVNCTVPDTAIITVTITNQPDAGIDNAITLCTEAAAVNLINNLGGIPDTSGSWTDPNGNPFGTNDRGALDPATAIGGIYTYSVGATACSATATITVTLEDNLDAGEDATLNICSSETAVNLFTILQGTPDTGGNWTDPNGNPFGTADVANLDPAAVNALSGNYTYSISSVNCTVPDTAIVTVTITNQPDAGTDNAITLCTEAAAVNLIDNLAGTPQNAGSWTDPNGNTFGANDQGTLDPSTAIAGIYTYSVGATACSATATVTVTLEDNLDAGEDATLNICSSETAVNLFTILQGTPDTGGNWTDPNGNPFGTNDLAHLNPAAVNALSGDYTYTVGSVNCTVPSTAKVSVLISLSPELNIIGTSCATDRATYDVNYSTNGNWNISISPEGSAIIDTSNSTITGITANIDVVITATNPKNSNCSVPVSLSAPNCNCPDISEPTNLRNVNICEGTPNPTLSVDVLAGQTANWYDNNGDVLATNTTTFTPSDTAVGHYIYSVEAFDTAELCTSDLVNVVFNIIESPSLSSIPDVTVCDNYILPSLTLGNYFTQPNGLGTRLEAGEIVETSQILYVYTETETTPNCTAEVELDITINPLPNPVAPITNNDIFCERYILPEFTDNNQSYFTESDGLGTELFPDDIIIETQDLYLREVSDSGCANEVMFTVNISNIIEIDLEVFGAICVEPDGTPITTIDLPEISTFLNENDYSFTWSLNGEIIPGAIRSSVDAALPGIYTVNYTNLSTLCSSSASTSVESIEGPSNLQLSLSNDSPTNNRNTITVSVDGSGDYLYILDDNTPQESNVFSSVPLGLHTVTVLDNNGCGQISDDIFVVGFPKYFTPNNDAINDSWNVITDKSLPKMNIHIFDRYGKLIKVITSSGEGWDGTYNGRDMPTSDYWFLAEFTEGGRTYKSYFTLKR